MLQPEARCLGDLMSTWCWGIELVFDGKMMWSIAGKLSKLSRKSIKQHVELT
jgi:hypothetical protein